MSRAKTIGAERLRQRTILFHLWMAVLVAISTTVLGCSTKTSTEHRPPAILLEATLTRHGIGGFRHSSLLVRLAEDGNVEWDDLEWDPTPKASDAKGVDVYRNIRNVTTIGSDKVVFIERRLGSLDLQNVQDRMGPYNAYIDSSYEIQVRMAKAASNSMVFSVSNPWCGEGETCFNSRPLPSNLLSYFVRSAVCVPK